MIDQEPVIAIFKNLKNLIKGAENKTCKEKKCTKMSWTGKKKSFCRVLVHKGFAPLALKTMHLIFTWIQKVFFLENVLKIFFWNMTVAVGIYASDLFSTSKANQIVKQGM